MKVFVSYSDTQLDDQYIERFCVRLNDALATKLGEKASAHVLSDRALRQGDNWQARLTNALNDADVFLALYAPLVFSSEWAGRELGCFLDRLPSEATEVPIVPVWWETTIQSDANGFSLPPASGNSIIDNLQHRSKSSVRIGEYDTHFVAQNGLKILIGNEEHRDLKPILDYYLNELAIRIIALGDKYRGKLGRSRHDLGNAPDIWKQARKPASAQVSVETNAQTVHFGSRVHFFVLAARPEEIVKVRGAPAELSRAYFKAGGTDWRPYWPDKPCHIGLTLKRIVIQNIRDTDPEVEEQRDIAAALKAAMNIESSNQPLFFILDAWSARLDDYAEFVKLLSRALLPQSAVVLPFVDTQKHADVLAEMFKLLDVRESVDDELLKPWVAASEEDLERIITNLHERIRAKFRKRGERGWTVPFSGGIKPSLTI